ncbi:hypothetical protein [Comamonas sp. JC664]|uniref:hypothetical protein n=1 Tax=Comamonas sp. JC664 TaxID=2801917 RepID=UPI00174C1991|nr:hypothetical protein [Comamonas sp. JC664]MBL0696321.1 hypothetical protein [Comamonas sp. JC664]GHG66473.1 hypothetical protein GCM10012319_08580 [Comamonas sp. KCTC 72670]
MTPRKQAAALALWTLAITVLHVSLNVRWDGVINDFRPEQERKLNVAYIPVT